MGGTDIIEHHDFINGDINNDIKSVNKGINNNNIDELHDFDVEEEGFEGEECEPDTMGEPGLVNTALDKIGRTEVDVFDDDEPVIERKAYSNPELRDLMLHPRVTGYDEDGPRELTEDEYQEFLEDSECLVENGDVEPVAPDCDEPHGDADEPHGDIDEPHGDIDEPIEVENETGLKKLAPNMGDISPLDEYPPLGGFHGFGDSHGVGDPDGLSDCSDIDEPREGSPEPDMCYPPHAPAHEYLDPPSSDDEDLMPADTADSVENILNDSVEREAVAELRNKSKNKVIPHLLCHWSNCSQVDIKCDISNSSHYNHFYSSLKWVNSPLVWLLTSLSDET